MNKKEISLVFLFLTHLFDNARILQWDTVRKRVAIVGQLKAELIKLLRGQELHMFAQDLSRWVAVVVVVHDLLGRN